MKKGVADLHWRDAVLNLPPYGHSWQLQRFAEMACRSGSFQDGHDLVLAATGVSTGKRQLEEIVARAAADAEEFAAGRPVPDAPVIAGPDGEERPAVLGMSADAKGVSMRPDALRAETARKAAKRDRKGDKRLGSGEKQAKKRMAETGAVFDSLPPDGQARTPQDIMVRPAGQPPRTPQALNKWYTCGITATCAEVIAQVMAEAGRRDPELQRDWLALVDGNAHQIACLQNEAADQGKAITILIDFIHVIEYLWKAALAFTPPGDTRATEDQVTAWGLDILAGNSRGVIAGITARAAADPPRPGGEHEKNIRKTTHYLQAKEPFLGYPAALAKGWPIATGIIEGACRHIIGDRLGITGPAGAWPAPRPCSGCAPSPPAATCPPTGTGTSPVSTTATTSASSRIPPRLSTHSGSPHERPPRKLTLKERHPCDIVPVGSGLRSLSSRTGWRSVRAPRRAPASQDARAPSSRPG